MPKVKIDLQTPHIKLNIEASILVSLQWTTHDHALQEEFEDTKEVTRICKSKLIDVVL
jgi:hypothetical protein